MEQGRCRQPRGPQRCHPTDPQAMSATARALPNRQRTLPKGNIARKVRHNFQNTFIKILFHFSLEPQKYGNQESRMWTYESEKTAKCQDKGIQQPEHAESRFVWHTLEELAFIWNEGSDFSIPPKLAFFTPSTKILSKIDCLTCALHKRAIPACPISSNEIRGVKGGAGIPGHQIF